MVQIILGEVTDDQITEKLPMMKSMVHDLVGKLAKICIKVKACFAYQEDRPDLRDITIEVSSLFSYDEMNLKIKREIKVNIFCLARLFKKCFFIKAST